MCIKGGGGLVNQLRRSYSTGEIGEDGDMNRNIKALPHARDHTYDDIRQPGTDLRARYQRVPVSHSTVLSKNIQEVDTDERNNLFIVE